MGIHNGAVELLTNIGDVLLSSGGNDGNIVGWDINTGHRLGTFQCHSGTRLTFNDGAPDIITLRSCVVDVLMSGRERSLISLCRDGSLRLFKMNVNHCL
jgi:WD40 repeat protein